MPRLFIAIDLPERHRHDLEAICCGLPAEARWTPPGQLHLTLRFIGEVEAPFSLQIRETLATIPFSPFPVMISGLGFFPLKHRPSILWAGVVENPEHIQLQGQIERRLVQLGVTPENRRFHPHLTLARLSPGLSQKSLRTYLALHGQLSLAPFQVDCFHLYSSLLTRNGAVHHREGSFCAR